MAYQLSAEKKKELDEIYSQIERPTCIHCQKKDSVVPIVVGRPTEELVAYSETGAIKFGGGCGMGASAFYCNSCGKPAVD